MNNPYSPTTADLSAPAGATATYQPKIFAMGGRIGRLRYIAYLMGVSILMLLAMMVVVGILTLMLGLGPNVSTVLMALAYIPVVALSFILIIRRLNDMGKSGWLSLLNLVPIVNIGLALWLLFGRGDDGANQYGPPPCANTNGVIAACIAPLVFVVLVGMMAAAFIPMITGMFNPASTQLESPEPAAVEPAAQ